MRIVKEPIPPDQQDVQRRPDVALIEDNQTTYIDFAIAEPAASSFQTGPNSSLNTPGGAAIQKEEQKRLHYANLGLDAPVQPFVIESTGHIGPTGTNIINHLFRDSPRILRMFRRNMSFVLAAYLGRMICECRDALI
jgi:hypothetical protein